MSVNGVQLIEKLASRHLADYERLRAKLDRPGSDPALRGAVGRVWEAVYALTLAVERHKAEAQAGTGTPRPASAPEVCTGCGAWISTGDTPHVFDDRCVCFACYNRLQAEQDKAEARRLEATRPPTGPQMDQARRLGLAVPDGTSRTELANLLTTYLTRPAPPAVQHEAAVMGLTESAAVPWHELRRRLDERYRLYHWVYSVCRHLVKAQWETYADSRLPHNAIIGIVGQLAGREALVQAVRDHPLGTAGPNGPAGGRNGNGWGAGSGTTAPDGVAEAGAGEVAPAAGASWFVFEPADEADDAYRATRELVERELWAYLPHVPRRPGGATRAAARA